MGRALVTPPALEPMTLDEAVRHLRIAEPTTEPRAGAPSVALAGAGAGNVNAGAHRYRVTFVTADGETDAGDASEAATVVNAATDGKVAISDISIGSSRVTSRKLYRTAAGGSVYLLAAAIADNTSTSYIDNVADASLGVGAPSTNTTDDPYIRSLITSSREFVERETERALVTQTWEYTLDRFPCSDEPIRLPWPPLQRVVSIDYLDESGNETTLDDARYVVDTGSLYGEISLAYGASWPSTYRQRKAITVRFVAGYGDPADVPEALKAAMKLVLSDLYEHRSSGITGTIHTPNPALGRLLSPFSLVGMA